MAFRGLPDFVSCADEECNSKYFLTFNRDAYGKWSAGYVEFDDYLAVCAINNADSLDEVVVRMKASLKRNIDENPGRP